MKSNDDRRDGTTIGWNKKKAMAEYFEEGKDSWTTVQREIMFYTGKRGKWKSPVKGVKFE